MRRRDALRLAGCGLAAFGLAACGSGGGGGSQSAGGTLLDVARSNGLDRFLRNADTAGLERLLVGGDPYTIFAPSDRAFAAASLGRLDPDALRRVLGYHMVPGTLTVDFLEGMDVNHTTLIGVPINVDGVGGLKVNGAAVIRPNLVASNGVVHIIDRVLIPPR